MKTHLLIPKLKQTVWGKEGCVESAGWPFVIKWLVTEYPLSVQVHPKTEVIPDAEIWCVVDARPESRIHIGWTRNVSREEILQALHEKKITSLMNEYKPVRGDCYMIPAGTVHALGAGVTVWEVAPVGNVTLRLDDWGRCDGSRPLQIEECLEILT
ncbi:MAG: class I mannose-6-phosphate isomerase [Planctomycetaceae bacterium]|nr:class I mannose-6-phosphate isomerase [Planctomycetaceae bacterium]